MRFSRRLSVALLVVGCASAASVAQVWYEPPVRYVAFGPSWVAGAEYGGEKLALRMDPADLMTNIGSKRDGAGMCVNTSIETNARGLGLDQFRGYRDWSATEGGGSYPEKVEDQLARYCRAKGLPAPRYVQYTGPDPGPILDAAERTGRGCAIAYGYSPRYGSAINHMVFCPHPGKDGGNAAICDNNVFGGVTAAEASRYEWMSRAELVARMRTQADRWNRAVTGQGAWVFVWLEPPCPPSPAQFPKE